MHPSDEARNTKYAFKLGTTALAGVIFLWATEPGIFLYMGLGVLAFIAWYVLSEAWTHFRQAPTDAGSGAEEAPFYGDEEIAALVAEHEDAGDT